VGGKEISTKEGGDPEVLSGGKKKVTLLPHNRHGRNAKVKKEKKTKDGGKKATKKGWKKRKAKKITRGKGKKKKG